MTELLNIEIKETNFKKIDGENWQNVKTHVNF